MLAHGQAAPQGTVPFTHSALLYGDEDEYLAGTIPFITSGLDADEAVMVTVPATRLTTIQEHLGSDADDVMLVPMERLGRNPAWIIPAWVDFVSPFVREGLPVRGVGEPIWSGRSEEELVECVRHEKLLNLALADAFGFQLLCPFDIASLDPHLIETAHRNHPTLERRGEFRSSARFDDVVSMPVTDPLPPVPDRAEPLTFDQHDLWAVRERIARTAALRGLRADRLEGFEVSVSEALANTVCHGGGHGEIACWSDGTRFVCEVRDRGTILDPLAGRVRPGLDQEGGRGLWLMNQLCDLVQIRVLPDGTQVVRLHMAF